MSNYPDDIRQYDDNPNSPFYDDRGLEDAHIAKCKEVESDESLVAEIISELSNDKYGKLMRSVNDSLSVIGRFMSDALDSVDAEEWQLIIAKLSMNAQLPVDAGLIVEEAISDYAMAQVLDLT